MREKEAQLDNTRPNSSFPKKLKQEIKKKLRKEGLAYVKNVELLEKLRVGDFKTDLKVKVSKRVMQFLNSQEQEEVLERERLIIKEMDREIQRLVSKISKTQKSFILYQPPLTLSVALC